MGSNKRTRSPIERWEANILRPKGPAGCWIWSTDANRMDFKVDGVTWRAARWGYQHLMGSIPQEKVCLRICDTERCVNPAHHRPMERGRPAALPGPRNVTPTAKRPLQQRRTVPVARTTGYCRRLLARNRRALAASAISPGASPTHRHHKGSRSGRKGPPRGHAVRWTPGWAVF